MSNEANNETGRTAVSFTALPVVQRAVFSKLNYSFLQDTVNALAANGVVNEKSGKPYSYSLVWRTWRGDIRTPNPRIAAELDLAYRRITDRDAQRRSRLKRATRPDRAA